MYDLGDIVEMKKPHTCQVSRWQVICMGIDIKIKCMNYGHIVTMPRHNFTKKSKKVIEKKTDQYFDVSNRKENRLRERVENKWH